MKESVPSSTKSKRARVVIIGGGFGGMAAARGLSEAPVDVTVIDRTNHHLFQPLLYQVATAGLSPADIARPIRTLLRARPHMRVVMRNVTDIRVDAREVIAGGQRFVYDYLVVAAGARHSYFGREDWEEVAPGLKTLDDALELRRRILWAFERAEMAEDEGERERAMTFVVVGAGPTGVEMAGAISELARFSLRKDFRHIDPTQARVILVEAGLRVLSGFSEETSRSALEQLGALGVEVRVNARVVALAKGHVELDSGAVACDTVVWAAGNVGSPLGKMLGCPLDRQGRVVVRRDLTVEGHPEIQAIGDMAATTYGGGRPVPGVSPAAMQAGRHAAGNICRMLRGEQPSEWEYFDKGSMATIGRNAAVVEMGSLKMGGLPAWLAWAFVHLYFLISFRNRTLVFLQWAWAYFTYSKGARLISHQPSKAAKGSSPPQL